MGSSAEIICTSLTMSRHFDWKYNKIFISSHSGSMKYKSPNGFNLFNLYRLWTEHFVFMLLIIPHTKYVNWNEISDNCLAYRWIETIGNGLRYLQNISFYLKSTFIFCFPSIQPTDWSRNRLLHLPILMDYSYAKDIQLMP